MDYGKLKKGDVVKYNHKAKKQIPSAIDDKERVVINVHTYNNGIETAYFDDDSCSDVFWITKVRRKKQNGA